MVDMGIGTPSQSFSMLLDTGSSVTLMQWTWVLSTECIQCRPLIKKLNGTDSSTYVARYTNISISYGDGGMVTGTLSQDSMILGNVTVSQAFFLSITAEQSNDNLRCDGILGLGFSSLSYGYATVIERMKATGVISKAVFSMYLSSGDWSQSMLIIGDVDLAKYAVPGDTLSYIGLSSTYGFWEVTLTSLSFHGLILSALSVPTIFDSGTSFIYGPSWLVQIIYSQLSMQYTCGLDYNNMLVCICDNSAPLEHFPSLGFTFQGLNREFAVRPETYMYKEGNYCWVLVIGDSSDVWILGDAFLREYYTVYDIENNRIGLVRSVDVAVASSFGYLPLFCMILLGASLSVIYCRYLRRGKNQEFYQLLTDKIPVL